MERAVLTFIQRILKPNLAPLTTDNPSSRIRGNSGRLPAGRRRGRGRRPRQRRDRVR